MRNTHLYELRIPRAVMWIAMWYYYTYNIDVLSCAKMEQCFVVPRNYPLQLIKLKWLGGHRGHFSKSMVKSTGRGNVSVNLPLQLGVRYRQKKSRRETHKLL